MRCGPPARAQVVIESLLLAGIIGYVIYTRFVNTPMNMAAEQQVR